MALIPILISSYANNSSLISYQINQIESLQNELKEIQSENDRLKEDVIGLNRKIKRLETSQQTAEIVQDKKTEKTQALAPRSTQNTTPL